MKRSMLFLLLCCCTMVRADLLDNVARQLDIIEKEYWLAQRQQASLFRERVTANLVKLRSDIGRIDMQLRRYGKLRVVNFSSGINALQANFSVLTPTVVQAFYFTFKGTGMSDYTKEFRALHKEKMEKAEAEEGEGKKRPKKRSVKVYPNLKNVDLVEYERWLSERMTENLEKFVSRNSRFFRNNVTTGKKRRSYKGFSSNEHEKVHNCVSEYLVAIKEIRLGLVKARQLTNIEFK